MKDHSEYLFASLSSTKTRQYGGLKMNISKHYMKYIISSPDLYKQVEEKCRKFQLAMENEKELNL